MNVVMMEYLPTIVGLSHSIIIDVIDVFLTYVGVIPPAHNLSQETFLFLHRRGGEPELILGGVLII